MKRLLITGGLGFVGSHIVEGVLKQTDWQIIILDKYSYAGNFNRLTDIDCWKNEKHRIKIIYHDLRAPISSTTSQMIGEIDYIFHLAAESHVERSLQDSIPFIESNVLGTANLLEWVKHEQLHLQKYIGFNTDEVFGPAPPGINYKEDDKFYPSNPYSASKGAQWCLEYAFAHSFGLPILQIHSMNIFGERQHCEKFVPRTIKALLNNEKIILHGIKEIFSSRKWIHARNVCDALLFLIEKGERGENYNIIGEEKNVFEMANIICEIIKGKRLLPEKYEVIDVHSLRPGHDLRYSLSGEKMEKLGWRPPADLRQSLRKTVKWIIENPRWL